MAKRAKKKFRKRKPRVKREKVKKVGRIVRVDYQIGKSNVTYDRRLRAKPPGWRPSPSGGYFEARRNRSDMSPPKKL